MFLLVSEHAHFNVYADLQAYFRDVTQEDLQVLLPAFHNPLEDPVYKVPPIGPHFSADDLILSPRATRGLKTVGASHSGKRNLVSYALQYRHTIFPAVCLAVCCLLKGCCLLKAMMLQAPSLLGADTHAGSQALEDADTVGGSCLGLSVCSHQPLDVSLLFVGTTYLTAGDLGSTTV